MKNFVKNLSVYLTVVMCLIGCVSFAVPGFAAETQYEYIPIDVGAVGEYETLQSPNYWDDYAEVATDGSYSGDVYVFLVEIELQSGTYVFEGVALEQSSSMASAPLKCAILPIDADSEANGMVRCEFGVPFDVIDTAVFVVVAQSHNVVPTLYRVVEAQPEGLYYEAYDLFRELIFDPDFEITPPQEWCLAILATITTLFIIVIPFIVVWFVLASLGRWR